MSEKMTATANSAEQGSIDIDFAECAVPKWSRRRFLTMFMIMLGFTFFSASMWVGQEMAAGLDFWGFIKALLLGGAILGVYTGLLGYVGAETGLSLDLLSKRAFGEKGSYISSALTSFTQIGWFGVGIAMFAIPVARELFGGSTAVEWVLDSDRRSMYDGICIFWNQVSYNHQLYCRTACCSSWNSGNDHGSKTGRWHDH
ncbi:MAG: cytosine permease [Dorea sp.]